MTNEHLNFEASRMRGVLKVMEGDRKRFAELEKKLKLIESEYNLLKIKYLELQENYIKKVYGDV